MADAADTSAYDAARYKRAGRGKIYESIIDTIGDTPLVALPNLTNPYYVAMQKGFEEAAAEAGFTVEVQIANNDDAQQLAQVQAMLQKDPCALALNGVKSEPAAAIVKAANDAGVPVFTVNVTVSPEALTDQQATIVQYPVSYTHLDVYKRQILTLAPG